MDGDGGVKKREEDRYKCVVYESTLSTAARSPFPKGEGYDDTRIPLFSHCQSEYTHMWKNNTGEQSLPREGKAKRTGAERPITICGEAAATTLNPQP